MKQNYAVSFTNRAGARGKGRKGGGRWSTVYVKASSPELARECARRNNFSKTMRIMAGCRVAPPAEMGAISSEDAAKLVKAMQEAYRRKYGT